jgi:hypothetical protein
MRGRVGAERTLQGWRCLDCGHSEVTRGDIEWATAQALLPRKILRACETQTLYKLVRKVLAVDVAGAEKLRNEVLTAARASGIAVKRREGWMRPCPKCRRKDTAVFRWNVLSCPQARCVPADDNLPLSK